MHYANSLVFLGIVLNFYCVLLYNFSVKYATYTAFERFVGVEAPNARHCETDSIPVSLEVPEVRVEFCD